MWDTIKNPSDGTQVIIFSKKGRDILKKYIVMVTRYQDLYAADILN